MTKKSITLILFCCSIVFPAAAQSSEKKEPSLPLFSLAKKPVPADEFIYLYRKNHTEKSGEFTQQKIEEYLDLFINFKLKVEEARRRGLDTTRAFLKEYGTYREELRKPYLPDTRILDSLVELTYKRMKEEVRASHILLNLKPDAAPEDTLKVYQRAIEIRNRILAGEAFEAVAVASSEDPSAQINKGDLGYFTAMQMVYPFEQAAYTTPAGSISMPVRTRFGYHLVKVIDRQPARGEVEVSHIMIRTGEGFDNEKAKNTIFDIYEQLQKGMKWEELVKEHSQDPSSKDNGGKLRPFGVGAMAGVPEFERMAFALKKPGDLSDPFQTQFGWHILRLESKISLPAFQDMAASLKNRVSRDERSQVSRQVLQSKMKKTFGFTEDPQVKAKVLALADTALHTGKWKAKPEAVAPTDVLFVMKGKPHAAIDFLLFAERSQKPNSVAPAQYLEQLYNQYIDEALGQLMEEKIRLENPDYNWLLKEYYEGILLFEIMEKEVWNKATADTVGQQNYYKTHASDYRAGERVKAKIFSAPSKVMLGEVLKPLIEAGDSVKIQEFVREQNIRQETGAFEKTDRPVLGKISWSKGVFLAENNGTHYLVWVRDLIPPGSRSFSDARAAVISDYQNHLEKRWLEQLRKKYPVKINKKGKQYTLQQLVKH
jgi:peptidyl-prolyl cis-trans isomerase SurA